MLKNLIGKFVRNDKGQVVMWQTPNLPLIGWFVSLIISYILPVSLGVGFGSLSTLFLFLWSYLEITDGASYFRRFIGLIVMVVVVVGLFTNL